MFSELKCLPCLLRQAIAAMELCDIEPTQQQKILQRLCVIFDQQIGLLSPPEMARIMHQEILHHTNITDPYLQIKQRSTHLALEMYDKLTQSVSNSDQPLLTALKLAIAGNIIDYGVNHDLNLEQEIAKIVTGAISERKEVFAFEQFSKTLAQAKNILYLADNVGETVFDRILIEEILRSNNNKKITYAVKNAPIINDALRQDAVDAKIDKLATIISSGSDAPGSVLTLCTPEFIELYNSADMVISKGQGNFEALSPASRPIFFLLRIKCDVVSKRNPNWQVGDIVLYHEH